MDVLMEIKRDGHSFVLTQTNNSCSTMAAFLHHCPFLKSVPKPALRRTGATLLSLADRCPIIARQIGVSGPASLDEKLSVSPIRSKTNQLISVDQRRLFAQTAAQVAVSVSKDCPFVTSQIGMVQASPEVQEDIQAGGMKFNRGKLTTYQKHDSTKHLMLTETPSPSQV